MEQRGHSKTAPERYAAPQRISTNILQTARGVPSPELIHAYKRWGEGGIGTIVTGNMMVAYDAVEGYGNTIFCDNHDGRLEKYRELARGAKVHGSLLIAQISHPGRQGVKALNPNPVSASDVQLKVKIAGNEFAKPRALSVSEIKDIVNKFAETAYWCHRAGYDGAQVCADGSGCLRSSYDAKVISDPRCSWLPDRPIHQSDHKQAD